MVEIVGIPLIEEEDTKLLSTKNKFKSLHVDQFMTDNEDFPCFYRPSMEWTDADDDLLIREL